MRIWFSILIASIFLFSVRLAYAGYTGPALKMPLPPGYKWGVNTAVGDVGDSAHQGTGYYSIDFDDNVELNGAALPSDLGDGVVDVLAAAEGDVVEMTKEGCYNGGNYEHTCKVVIDHGNGYKTVYLHFTEGEVYVVKDQHVKQGQVLGKLGNTGHSFGPHLHFQIKHDNNSSASNSGLAGVTLEGIPFTSYTVGSFYPSTNGFTYPASNNPVACGDEPTGGFSTNWVYSCSDQRSIFTADEKVYGLMRINTVTTNFRTKIELWKGTSKLAEQVSGWNTVDPVWGWNHNFFWYFHRNVSLTGNLELRYYIDTENNQGTDFLPVPFAKKAFTVNSPPFLYTYDGNAYTCSVEPTTAGESSGWWYDCPSRTVFSQGETVYGLVRIDNVYADHRFKIEAWKNGVFQWDWQWPTPPTWTTVDPVWGWSHAFFWPALFNASVGIWQFKYFVDVGSGFGTAPFAQRSFSVQ